MIRSVVRIGIATLLAGALALPAQAEAFIHSILEFDQVVIPGGWGLEEGMDGAWVFPDGVAGYSDHAQVLIVDDFYNPAFLDPPAQVATIFGYLTSSFEIEERMPAISEPPAADADYAYFSIDGYRQATADMPRLHVMAVLIQNPDGTERAYYLEATSDEETLDLLMLCGMLNGSRDFTEDERESVDLKTYSYTHSKDYEEEDL